MGIFGRSLARASWASSARSLTVVLFSGSYLGLAGPLSSQRSACHHGGASRALVPMWLMVSELSGSRVAAPLVLGKLPRQGSCRGSLTLPLCSSCFWSSSSLVCSWSPQRSACYHACASRALVPMLSTVSELLVSRVSALLVLGKLPRQDS